MIVLRAIGLQIPRNFLKVFLHLKRLVLNAVSNGVFGLSLK